MTVNNQMDSLPIEQMTDDELTAELDLCIRVNFEIFALDKKCKIDLDESVEDGFGRPIYRNVITQMAWMAYREGYLKLADDIRAGNGSIH